MKRFKVFGIALAAAGLLGWAGLQMAEAHTKISTDITWAKYVRDILREKCMDCHYSAGMAPDYIDFTLYGTDRKPGAWAWRKAMEEEMMTGRMPPWQADSRYGEFANSKELTAEERELILLWAQGGGPQGTPFDLPSPPEYLEPAWALGEPDLIVTMPEEHVFAADKLTDYVSVMIPIETDEDQWITGYEFRPGTRRGVHTIIALIHDPEGRSEEVIEMEYEKPYDPLADEDDLIGTRDRRFPKGPHFMGQWVRGDLPVILPEEAGRRLPAGATIELQIYYKRSSFDDYDIEFRDRSQLGLYLATEPIDLLVESKRIANEDFILKAGEANQEVLVSYTFEENVDLLGFNPHMSDLASDLQVRSVYPDGKSVELLWIPNYQTKWETSYTFEKPLYTPIGVRIEFIGHFDNSAGNENNPNSPPKDIQAGPGPHQTKLVAWLDYTLKDHMMVTTPTPTPRPLIVGDRRSGMAVASIFDEDDFGQTGPTDPGEIADAANELLSKLSPGALDAEPAIQVFWCPMHVVGSGACLHDYHAPGKCDECGMPLLPKAAWMEKYAAKIAADTSDWELTDSGLDEVYWCENRSNPDHTLKDYAAPGRCEIDGAPLIHKSRFEFQQTWVCLTEDCADNGKVYYSSGTCPTCGQPVQSMGHMDHNPIHGGLLFMADNLFHHVEGTLPAPGEFRLFFYDDWKRPLDPRNFTASVVIERFDEETEEILSDEYEVALESPEDGYFTARIPEGLEYPIEVTAVVGLAGEDTLFTFAFDELSLEPEPGVQANRIRLHAHGERLPVEIPEDPAEVVREIVRRDAIIQSRIEAKDWFGMHVPAYDTIDLAKGLKEKSLGLRGRDAKRFFDAIAGLNLASDRLDRAGDAQDEGRVDNYYKTYSDSLAVLLELFPDAR